MSRLLFIPLFAFLPFTSFATDQISSVDKRTASESLDSSCEQSGRYIFAELKLANQNKNLSSALMRSAPFPTSRYNVKRSCIEQAQKQVTAGHWQQVSNQRRVFVRANDFIKCSADSKSAAREQMTPCSSRDTVALTHNAFELVTQCLAGFVADSTHPQIQKSWIRTYYRLVSKESGFHNHVISRSGAVGIGQVREVYRKDFLMYAYDSVDEYLAQSLNPECNRLGREVLPKTKKASWNKCDYVGFNNDQILTNLIVSFANLRTYRSRAHFFLNQNAKSLRLSPQELLKAEHDLVAWGYNGGSNNLRKWIQKGLEGKESNPVRTREQLYTAIWPKIDKPESKNYLHAIAKRHQDILDDSGENSCWMN